MDDVDVIDLCDSTESADDEVTLVESESDADANDPHSPEPIYVSSDSDSGSLTVSETLLTRAHEPAEALSSPRNCEDLTVESKSAGCASSSTASDRPARCALGPSDAICTLSRANARLNRQTPSPSKASNTRSSPRHGDIRQFLSPRRAGKVPMIGSAPGTSPQGTSVPVAAARSLSWCGTSNSAGGARATIIEGLDGRSPPLRIKAEKHGHAYSPLRNHDLAKYAIDAKSANSVCPNVKIESRTDCEPSVLLAPKPQDGGPAEIGTWQAESDSLENVKVESSSDSDTAVVSLPRRAVAKQSHLHRPGTGESARNPHSDSDSENPTLRLVRPYIRFDSGSESDQISVASRKRKRRGDTPHDRGAPLPSSEQKRRIQDESSSSDNNYVTVQGSHQDTDSRILDNDHPSGMSTQNSDSQRRKYRHQRSASVYAAKSIVSIAGGGSDNDSATDSSDACAGCGEAGPTVECARCNLPFHSGCIESRSNKPHVVCGNCRKQQSAKRRRRARIGNVKLEMAGAQDGRVQGSHGLQQSVEKVPLLIMDTKEPSCEQPFTESARSKRKRLQDHTTAVLETLGGEISFERLCAGLRTPTTITSSAADKNSPLKSSVLCPTQGCVRQFATWKGLAWHLAGGGCESAAGGDLFESSNDESCTFQCHWRDCNKACSSAANLVRHLSKDHLTDDARLRGCLWRRCDDIGPVSTDEVEPASFFVAHVAAHVFSDL